MCSSISSRAPRRLEPASYEGTAPRPHLAGLRPRAAPARSGAPNRPPAHPPGRYYRGQLSRRHLVSNTGLKLVKYTLSAVLCFGMGLAVPFVYPHPYVFIAAEQLGANIVADMLVSHLGIIEPS